MMTAGVYRSLFLSFIHEVHWIW